MCVCVYVCVCVCLCVRVCVCVYDQWRGVREGGSKIDRRDAEGAERRVAGLGKAVRGRCLGEGCSFVNNSVDVAMMRVSCPSSPTAVTPPRCLCTHLSSSSPFAPSLSSLTCMPQRSLVVSGDTASTADVRACLLWRCMQQSWGAQDQASVPASAERVCQDMSMHV